MLHHFFSAVILSGLLTQTTLGASTQLIEGLPSSYIPGQPVTFNVRLPAITNLGSYNIDVVLESTTGTAGSDFFFDVATAAPSVTNYVFPSTDNFFDAVNVDSPSQHRITLTDFDLVGVNVVTGVNDRVATVVFQTASTFDGPVSVFIAAPLLILDTPNITPTPIQDFETLRNDIAAAGAIELRSVPEPSSLLMSASLLLAVFGVEREIGRCSTGFRRKVKGLRMRHLC